MRIPEEIQNAVKQIIAGFNKNIINKNNVWYIPEFRGKNLFMKRMEYGNLSPVFRLTFNGKMDNWKFAIYRWSRSSYDEDELFIVPGINHFKGTVESAMKVGMEAYPV